MEHQQTGSKFVHDPIPTSSSSHLGGGVFSQPESKFVRDNNIQPLATPDFTLGQHGQSKFVTEAPVVKKGPCCVCKETKFARDECVRNNGLDKCEPFVAAHNACLKSEGFNVL